MIVIRVIIIFPISNDQMIKQFNAHSPACLTKSGCKIVICLAWLTATTGMVMSQRNRGSLVEQSMAQYETNVNTGLGQSSAAHHFMPQNLMFDIEEQYMALFM